MSRWASELQGLAEHVPKRASSSTRGSSLLVVVSHAHLYAIHAFFMIAAML